MDKAQSTIDEIKCVGKERRRGERKRQKEEQESPKQFLGRSGRSLFFLLLILMQNWLRVDAAAGRLKPKGEAGSAGNHYRVGCGGMHFRGPGREEQKKQALQRVEAVKRS